ncbi:MAG TPA: hypothetical protein VFM14_00635 [Gemmatimonadales bacterium]|nr:hypothetical protein [Gemmatimonadales bacterium]
MVAAWLEQHMFARETDAKKLATAAPHHFNDASTHKSHGRRIGREEARKHGVKVIDLEDDPALQDAVLTAYHRGTIAFEHGSITKSLTSDTGRFWLKQRPPKS